MVGPSSASVVTLFLERAGFWVVTWKLSPLMFGIPQSRERIYWLALEGSSMMERGFTQDSLVCYMRSCMDKLVGPSFRNTDQSVASCDRERDHVCADVRVTLRSAPRSKQSQTTCSPSVIHWRARTWQIVLQLG